MATGFDGYPMAQKGKAAQALGITTTMSCVGGVFGVLCLAIFTPLVSKISLNFSPVDYFLLGIMGLMMIGALGGGSMVKGLMGACVGVLLGRVGMDNLSGVVRFTFGFRDLMAGVPSVVAMIGLYGFSEALMQLKDKNFDVVKQDLSGIVPHFHEVIKHFWLTIRCSIIGTVVGALPGAGGTVAALLAYDHARRTVKNPEVPFGEGAIEGLVAPESSNNAAVGGAFIPMLTLGVPGDSVTAIIMSALIVHGMQPAPADAELQGAVLHRRYPVPAGQYSAASLRPDGNPAVCQIRGNPQGTPVPHHCDPGGDRRLRNQQPDGAHRLDDALRLLRIPAEKVQVSGGFSGAGNRAWQYD